MNARQKAKKYKKEIEFLKSRQIEPVNLIEHNYRNVRLEADDCVSLGSYFSNSEEIQYRIDRIEKDSLVTKLLNNVIEYVEFEKEIDQFLGSVVYRASLFVGEKQ